MKRLLSVGLMSAMLALPLAAQAQTQTEETVSNPRMIYTEARAEMDKLIMARQMGDAIRMFEGLGVPSSDELDAIDAQLRELYTEDFQEVGLVRSEVHKNGFRQEMIAYWSGQKYLYVYLLIHTEKTTPRLLQFQFDSNFDAIIRLF